MLPTIELTNVPLLQAPNIYPTEEKSELDQQSFQKIVGTVSFPNDTYSITTRIALNYNSKILLYSILDCLCERYFLAYKGGQEYYDIIYDPTTFSLETFSITSLVTVDQRSQISAISRIPSRNMFENVLNDCVTFLQYQCGFSEETWGTAYPVCPGRKLLDVPAGRYEGKDFAVILLKGEASSTNVNEALEDVTHEDSRIYQVLGIPPPADQPSRPLLEQLYLSMYENESDYQQGYIRQTYEEVCNTPLAADIDFLKVFVDQISGQVSPFPEWVSGTKPAMGPRYNIFAMSYLATLATRFDTFQNIDRQCEPYSIHHYENSFGVSYQVEFDPEGTYDLSVDVTTGQQTETHLEDELKVRASIGAVPLVLEDKGEIVANLKIYRDLSGSTILKDKFFPDEYEDDIYGWNTRTVDWRGGCFTGSVTYYQRFPVKWFWEDSYPEAYFPNMNCKTVYERVTSLHNYQHVIDYQTYGDADAYHHLEHYGYTQKDTEKYQNCDAFPDSVEKIVNGVIGQRVEDILSQFQQVEELQAIEEFPISDQGQFSYFFDVPNNVANIKYILDNLDEFSEKSWFYERIRGEISTDINGQEIEVWFGGWQETGLSGEKYWDEVQLSAYDEYGAYRIGHAELGTTYKIETRTGTLEDELYGYVADSIFGKRWQTIEWNFKRLVKIK